MKCLNDIFLVIPLVSDRILFKYPLNQISSEEHTHCWCFSEWQRSISISGVTHLFLGQLRDVITKYHTPSGLNKRNVFSHSSGGWKAEHKVPAWSVPQRALFLDFGRPSLLYTHMVERERERLLSLLLLRRPESHWIRYHPYGLLWN